jgi:hypothetical protein
MNHAPHGEQEDAREAVEERAVAREQLVGEGGAEEGRGGADAEGEEGGGPLERAAAGHGRDEGGVEEAAGEQAKQEAEARGVAGDAPAERARDAGEQPSAPGVGEGPGAGEAEEGLEHEHRARHDGGGALDPDERSGQLDDPAHEAGRGAEDGVGQDPPPRVPQLPIVLLICGPDGHVG